MRRVEISSEAEVNMDQSYDWLLENASKNIADNFYIELKTSIDSLSDDILETKNVYRDYKRKNLKRFKYSIYYKIIESEVIVFAVIHNARDFSYLLK